jgi:nucleoside 2-deoxyribosyltransferase
MKDGKPELYVACGLTHAPEEFRLSVDGLKHILRQERGYEVYDFVGLENGTPADVYAWDIGHCVAQSDLLVAVCDYPAVGLGWELGTAVEKLQKPTLAVAHEDTHVTRLITGAAEAGAPNYRFRRYSDLMEVPEYIDELLKMAKPRYQMMVDGNEEWHPIRDAGIVFDSGWAPVSIGGSVRELDTTRPITDQERTRIADIADEYSASK